MKFFNIFEIIKIKLLGQRAEIFSLKYSSNNLYPVYGMNLSHLTKQLREMSTLCQLSLRLNVLLSKQSFNNY